MMRQSGLVKDPFDNLTVVKSYSKPVLVIHGKHDEIIPYSHGVALYKAAKNGQMITYDCGRNDCPPNWKVFWRDIELFVKDAGMSQFQNELVNTTPAS